MKRTKRIFSLLVALVMCAGLTAFPARAADAAPNDGDTRIVRPGTNETSVTFRQGATTTSLTIEYQRYDAAIGSFRQTAGDLLDVTVDQGGSLVSLATPAFHPLFGTYTISAADLNKLEPATYTIKVNNDISKPSFTIVVRPPISTQGELDKVTDLNLQPEPRSKTWTEADALAEIRANAKSLEYGEEISLLQEGFTLAITNPTGFQAGDSTRLKKGYITVTVSITRGPPAGGHEVLTKTLTIGLRYIWDGYVPHDLSRTVAGANAQGVKLSLYTEKFTSESFKVAGYALNDKWKKGAPDDKVIARLLNKGGVLAVTDKLSDKAKDGPAEGASVITFEAVEKREKSNKLVINYVLGADDEAATPGRWFLTAKADAMSDDMSAAVLENLEIVKPAGGKKPDAKDIWGMFSVNGVAVEPLPEDGKPVKAVYFTRIKAYADDSGTANLYHPATKAQKVAAQSQQKTPKVKIDYKKNVIKVKAGQAVSLTGPDGFTLYAKSDSDRASAADKSGIGIENNVKTAAAGGSDPVYAFTFAGKKPASAVVKVYLADSAVITAAEGKEFALGSFNIAGGKATYDAKLLEFTDSDPAGGTVKWGKFPKFTDSSDDLWVRMKSTAKQDTKENKPMEGTSAVSAPVRLSVTVGPLNPDDPKTKNGVLSVKFYDWKPGASADSITIAGETGDYLTADVTITLKNAAFKDLNEDDDVTAWFTGLPAGIIKAEVKTIGSNTVTVTLSGTPTAPSTAKLVIAIPDGKLTRQQGSGDLTVTTEAKFNIL